MCKKSIYNINAMLELVVKIDSGIELSEKEKEMEIAKSFGSPESSKLPDDEPSGVWGNGEKSDKWEEGLIFDDYQPLPHNIIYSSCKRLGYLQNNDNFVYVKATSYDDLHKIAERLNKQLPIIVNFEDLDNYSAQKMFYFLSGLVYAYKGETVKNDFRTFTFDSR